MCVVEENKNDGRKKTKKTSDCGIAEATTHLSWFT